MIDATAALFDELARRGDEPLLRKATGTVRFDVVVKTGMTRRKA
jgi:hypothetical protein